MERCLCIHAHFYQPPRENPWLEAIEQQDSAYPFHDWNERITAECYAANSASRILDGEGRITKIVNNYARISFNFGPTLLSWMEVNSPGVYASILEADRLSRERFSGHGNAVAQVYNHIIMPLANRRDKETQVRWGIRDFESRFGRFPEGMWLSETAADVETLEVLAENGIKFTILAPHQARQTRRIGRVWKNVEGGKIDPKMPYMCKLPSGKRISLFFYDGPISRAVAFEKLLSSGENFANRLIGGFSNRDYPQLMNIATDGETYGHHHPHGDMALAYALEYIEKNNLAKITNYGEYLAKHPPNHEAEIIDNTSWSCAHGIERWRSDCGCNSGRQGWNQQWRKPLREALDWLRDDLTKPFEDKASDLVKDPWAARNDYIEVVLDRAPSNVDAFLERHRTHELNDAEQVALLKMLEMQRHELLMYTSCGWFFDEISGIETVQVMQYAARAVQLAQDLFGDHREQHFVEHLADAPSNLEAFKNGAEVYERYVKPATVNLLGVGAHFAISSLFFGFADHRVIYAYEADVKDSRVLQAGRSQLALGRVLIRSQITRNSADLTFAVLNLGDNNLLAGVRRYQGEAAYERTVNEAQQAFNQSDIPESIRVLDRNFEGTSYSVKSLFRDEQRRVVENILGHVLEEANASYRQIYENHASLMRFLHEIRMPLPHVMVVTGAFVVNEALRRLIVEGPLDLVRFAALLEEARRDNLQLDEARLAFDLRERLEGVSDALAANPGDVKLLSEFDDVINLVRMLPFEVNLWKAQNVYYTLLGPLYPSQVERTNAEARRWVELFRGLGDKLRISVTIQTPAVPPSEPVAA
jgi:alpha-amylase/alpha-mannosidase (GH57 family)